MSWGVIFGDGSRIANLSALSFKMRIWSEKLPSEERCTPRSLEGLSRGSRLVI